MLSLSKVFGKIMSPSSSKTLKNNFQGTMIDVFPKMFTNWKNMLNETYENDSTVFQDTFIACTVLLD